MLGYPVFSLNFEDMLGYPVETFVKWSDISGPEINILPLPAHDTYYTPDVEFLHRSKIWNFFIMEIVYSMFSIPSRGWLKKQYKIK